MLRQSKHGAALVPLATSVLPHVLPLLRVQRRRVAGDAMRRATALVMVPVMALVMRVDGDATTLLETETLMSPERSDLLNALLITVHPCSVVKTAVMPLHVATAGVHDSNPTDLLAMVVIVHPVTLDPVMVVTDRRVTSAPVMVETVHHATSDLVMVVTVRLVTSAPVMAATARLAMVVIDGDPTDPLVVMAPRAAVVEDYLAAVAIVKVAVTTGDVVALAITPPVTTLRETRAQETHPRTRMTVAAGHRSRSVKCLM
jgi:hypothetical protein